MPKARGQPGSTGPELEYGCRLPGPPLRQWRDRRVYHGDGEAGGPSRRSEARVEHIGHRRPRRGLDCRGEAPESTSAPQALQVVGCMWRRSGPYMQTRRGARGGKRPVRHDVRAGRTSYLERHAALVGGVGAEAVAVACHHRKRDIEASARQVLQRGPGPDQELTGPVVVDPTREQCTPSARADVVERAEEYQRRTTTAFPGDGDTSPRGRCAGYGKRPVGASVGGARHRRARDGATSRTTTCACARLDLWPRAVPATATYCGSAMMMAS